VNAFPGWRAVGQAMRWARHQKHIRVDRTTLEAPPIGGVYWAGHRIDNRWLFEFPVPDRDMTRTDVVHLEHYHSGGHPDLTVVAGGIRVHELDVADAGRVLLVLAALKLIPFVFAEAAAGDPYAASGAAVLAAFPSENGKPA
jgi:hypothetical protein